MFSSLLSIGVFKAVSRARIYLATMGIALLISIPSAQAQINAFNINKCSNFITSSFSSFYQANGLKAITEHFFTAEQQNVVPIHHGPSVMKLTPKRHIELISAYVMHNMLKFTCKVKGKGCESVASYAIHARAFKNQQKHMYASTNSAALSVASNDIYIGSLELEGYNKYIAHTLIPFSFGQQYIGQITAAQYGQAWKRYIDSLNAQRPNKANKKCYLSAAGSNLSVFGYNCMPFKGFERLEASADKHGTLMAVTIYHKISKSSADGKMFLEFLDSRYTRINPSDYGLQEIASLKQDLVKLMKILSHDQYVNEFVWHLYDGNKFLITKFVKVKDERHISVLFASKNYLLNEERLTTLRRLALVRKELTDQGIDIE